MKVVARQRPAANRQPLANRRRTQARAALRAARPSVERLQLAEPPWAVSWVRVARTVLGVGLVPGELTQWAVLQPQADDLQWVGTRRLVELRLVDSQALVARLVEAAEL